MAKLVNTPEVKLGVVGVSRDCFPIELTKKRLGVLMAALKAQKSKAERCSVVIENENDAMAALTELTDNGCNISEGTKVCTWILSGIANVPAGEHTVWVTVSDEDGGQADADITLTVEREEATVRFHGGNPVAVRVPDGNEVSGAFDLMVRVRETYDWGTGEEPTGEPWAFPGDIGLAQVDVMLSPVGPGAGASPTECTSAVADTGYDAKQTVVCSFEGVPVNTYVVQVTVDGDYYEGYGEDVVVVYDPSLGFATGGGSFYWPESTDLTNFGFTMEYNKKGKKVKGSLVLIRHRPDGSTYRVKSNALYGLALGQDPDPISGEVFGWASFSGKSTYMEPGWLEPVGNHEFLVYVEDRNEPVTGVDRFWIEVKDKDRQIVLVMSMDREATDNAVDLQGGNIVVPHG